MPRRKPRAAPQPEDILAAHTPEIQALAERLRRIVRATVPSAAEAAYPHWHGIGYRHPETGYFCAIFPQKDSVKLGFEFGVLLPDPEGLLDGTGKQVRYVHLQDSKDIRVSAIKRLLRAAISLPESRDAKLWLIKSSARPAKSPPRRQ